jgi:cytochrome c-type biogenesis protein CcmF
MLLFLGIIGSSRYSKEQNVSLPLDQPREALGYKMTYKGATPIPGDEQKYHFNVVVEKDGRGFLLQPIMYYSDYSQGVMKNPDIANLVTKDLYLSPQSLEVPEDYSKEDVVTIKKDETVETKGLKVKFVDFDRSKFNRNAMQEGKDNVMGATLEVMDGKRKEIVTAEEKISQGSQDPVPVQMEGNDKFTFFLTKVSVSGEETVDIAVVDNTQPKTNNSPETLVLTASIKPFINLVWLGTIVMVLGFFFSLVNRYRKLKSEALTEEPLSKNGMSKKKETLKSTNGNNGHRSKQKVST